MNQNASARSNLANLPSMRGGNLAQHITAYAANPLFGDSNDWILENNPFRRPVRPQDLDQLSFAEPVDADAFCSASGLSAQRMLFNIYETDLMLLPAANFAGVKSDFRLFYSCLNP